VTFQFLSEGFLFISGICVVAVRRLDSILLEGIFGIATLHVHLKLWLLVPSKLKQTNKNALALVTFFSKSFFSHSIWLGV
jgi:hypothetical protein